MASFPFPPIKSTPQVEEEKKEKKEKKMEKKGVLY